MYNQIVNDFIDTVQNKLYGEHISYFIDKGNVTIRLLKGLQITEVTVTIKSIENNKNNLNSYAETIVRSMKD